MCQTLEFALIIGAVAVVAGATASIAGFGIGSLLTPTLALMTGTKVAVAAIALPHFVGTLQRYWLLRCHVDRRVLFGFGITSAIGGLVGALIHVWLSSRALTIVFGALLILAAVAEFTGWMATVRWGRRVACRPPRPHATPVAAQGWRAGFSCRPQWMIRMPRCLCEGLCGERDGAAKLKVRTNFAACH